MTFIFIFFVPRLWPFLIGGHPLKKETAEDPITNKQNSVLGDDDDTRDTSALTQKVPAQRSINTTFRKVRTPIPIITTSPTLNSNPNPGSMMSGSPSGKPPIKPTHLPLNLNRDHQNNTLDGSLIFTNTNATIVGGGREMPPLLIKTKPISEDYEISGVTLGLGINGKVVECTNKISGYKHALKVLRDNTKARREVELHWRASGCKHIVSIHDVYQNNYKGQASLLVIMEWYTDFQII